jgi:hypothetical protein
MLFYIKGCRNHRLGRLILAAAGDMIKAVYDTNNNGRPDTADNSLQLSGWLQQVTTASVTAAINALVNSAPGAVDTLNEWLLHWEMIQILQTHPPHH